jgi:hypothetical protein
LRRFSWVALKQGSGPSPRNLAVIVTLLCRAEQNQATGRRKFRPLRRPMIEAVAERKSQDEKPLRPVWWSYNQRSWPLIRGGRVA